MAWHLIGDKPLPEPVMTQFTDAYMQHQGPVLLQWYGTVARIPANGSAAFNESCTPIG